MVGYKQEWHRKWYSNPKNRAKRLAYQKAYAKRIGPIVRAKQQAAWALKRWLATRGWTLKDLRRMRAAGCAICHRKHIKLEMDHDHKTGKARGLLCHGCNTRLGWIESPRFAAAQKYLQKFRL